MHESKAWRGQPIIISERQERGFWTKVDKSGPPHPELKTPCWLWRGGVTSDGYGSVSLTLPGVFTSTGRMMVRTTPAHRVAWRLVHGDWPAEFAPNGKRAILLHGCDIRNCVNVVDHIRIGTNAENAAEMVAHGRCMRNHDHWLNAEGENNGAAKLTEAQVAQIKGELAVAYRSESTGRVLRGVQSRLAEHFKVTPTLIYYIATDKIWDHVAAIIPEKSILPVRLNKNLANAKLSEESAREIRQLSAKGMTGRQLAAKFSVCPSTITNVLSGKYWPDTGGPVEWDPTNPLRVDGRNHKGENHPSSKLTDEIVREMRKRCDAGEPKLNLVKEYAAKMAVADKVIYEVLANKTWRHVVTAPVAFDLE